VHDAGALGIKTQATLKLIRTPPYAEYASFAFTDASAAVAALSEVARSDACEEAYLFDSVTTRSNLEHHAGLKQDLKTLGSVLRGQSSLLKGIRESAKLVAAGRNFAEEGAWVLHTLCAGRSAAAAGEDLEWVRSIAVGGGGTEIANSIPKAARAEPFGPLNGIIGHSGERWAALNAKVTHSDAPRLIKATEDLLAVYADRMQALNVCLSFLFIAISNHAFSYEPVLRWDDEWLPLHKRIPEPSHLEKLHEPAANPQARELVAEIRGQIVQLFADFGAASNQLGKTYPYLHSLQPEGRRLLSALKHELDPQGLMNPGALGDFATGIES
jgi:FAD/FMN-containing dehydrogenase